MKDTFMDTAKVMSKGQVTIPKRIRELLDLQNGDYVTFVVSINVSFIPVSFRPTFPTKDYSIFRAFFPP